jgi:hypothetical protein
MRFFVRRSSLTLDANEAVTVIAYFDDAAPIAKDMLRPELAMLSLPADVLQQTMGGFPQLAAGWRDNRAAVANGEAEHRILAAFPAHAQRNSLYELQTLILAHGASPAKWPDSASRRRSEIDRAWAYVEAVRRKADSMVKGALPADPTADSHWPTRPSPYRAA